MENTKKYNLQQKENAYNTEKKKERRKAENKKKILKILKNCKKS